MQAVLAELEHPFESIFPVIDAARGFLLGWRAGSIQVIPSVRQAQSRVTSLFNTMLTELRWEFQMHCELRVFEQVPTGR